MADQKNDPIERVAGDEKPATQEAAAPQADRRKFLTSITGLAAGVGAAAVAGTSMRAESRSKILARIQGELDGDYLDDPLTFHKGNGYSEYTKDGDVDLPVEGGQH